MKEIYQMNREVLYRHMEVDAGGLTTEEAEKIRSEKGENILCEGTKKSVFTVFFEQFCDLLVLILIVAAAISMLSGNAESTVVIFVVIILNAVLGTVQYVKAEKSLDALKALSAPHAKVLRDGKMTELESREVVPGDVLILEAGDLVAADGRIINSSSLKVNESSLTGESAAVEKTDCVLEGEIPLADRINMVYSGGLVTYGRAEVLVTGTGMDTEMGRIAGLMNETAEKRTPLQGSLDNFGKKLAIVIIIICILVFSLRLYQGTPVVDSMMFAVALAVAAIPEALGSIVTIVQAMGTKRMAENHAIMKKLAAVESLGCVSVICSDKTGTLTQNKMTVTGVYVGNRSFVPEELELTNRLHRYLLYNAILNNDSVLHGEQGVGDPTEYCLLSMAKRAGLSLAGVSEEDIRDLMPRLSELPFDSDRKMMSTLYRLCGKPVLFCKGAPDILLERCRYIALPGESPAGKTADTEDAGKTAPAAEKGFQVVELTEALRQEIRLQNQEFSKQGLRVLAFAYREWEEEKALSRESEQELIFTGLAAMMDPPREESAKAVADAKSAGIRTVMITGDHKVTAAAIAAKLGILEEGDIAVTGQELDAMDEEELSRKLSHISVYARVSPENKIRIVRAWQKQGHIVAMTGDGVNDAPALKQADIGVAMGITGTEVSKDAAAMILSDDNFATIISAVQNGRSVYRNIKNAIQFLLSGNLAGILSVLYCSLLALPAPFASVHLLFINLVTDSLPALAIGMEPSDPSLLKKKPRNPGEGILTRGFSLRLLLYGVLLATTSMTAFHLGLNVSEGKAVTMAFVTLTLARLFHGFNCRSEKPLFAIGIRSNLWSVAAFGVGVAMLALILFVPYFKGLFLVEALSGRELGLVILLAFAPTAVIQLVRMAAQSVYRS